MPACPADDDDDYGACNCTAISEFLRHIRSKNDQHVTHVALNGGKFCIPATNAEGKLSCEDKFYDVYATEVSLRHPKLFFFVEWKTLVFPMFYDYDEKSLTSSWTQTNRLDFVRMIQEDAMRFYPEMSPSETEHRFQVVVTTAPPLLKKTAEPAPEGAAPEGAAPIVSCKFGMHIYFPNLWVDEHIARLLRESALATLVNRVPWQIDYNVEGGWSEVIDASVYNPKTGLRMIGSDKPTTCTKCGGKRKTTCEVCTNGKIAQNRPYLLNTTLKHDGTQDESLTRSLKNDFRVSDYERKKRMLRVLQLTTLRTPGGSVPTGGFQRYEGSPSYVKTPKRGQRAGSSSGNKRKRAANEKVMDLKDSAITETIKAILNRLDHAHYHECGIKEATMRYTGKRPACIFVKVEGRGMNWCANVGRDHSQNQIYFQITPEKARQRCWSEKDRAPVCCRQFYSEPCDITHKERAILFEITTGHASLPAAGAAKGGVDGAKGYEMKLRILKNMQNLNATKVLQQMKLPPTQKKSTTKKPTAKPTAKKPNAKKPNAKKPTAKKPTAKPTCLLRDELDSSAK